MNHSYKTQATLLYTVPIAIGSFLISLNSYYFASIGIPIVPVAGGFVLIAALALVRARYTTSESISVDDLVIPGVLVIVPLVNSIVAGLSETSLIAYSYKTMLGYALGVLAFFSLAACRDFKLPLLRVFHWIVIVHLTAFYVQFVMFIVRGRVVDFIGPITGEVSRMEGGGLTRFTGLWVEPEMYATFAFGCLVVRQASNQFRFRIVDLLLVGSIVLCQSATGYGLIAMYGCVYVIYNLHRPKYIIGVVVCLAICAAIVVFANIDVREVYYRLRYPLDDQSGAVRFGGLGDYLQHATWVQMMLGSGVGSYAALMTGHNGAFSALVGFGLVGVTLWCAAILIVFRATRGSMRGLICWAVTLGAEPQQTWVYWWWILGLLAICGFDESCKPSPVRTLLRRTGNGSAWESA